MAKRYDWTEEELKNQQRQHLLMEKEATRFL